MSEQNKTQLIEDFIEYFKELSEGEQFKLGGLFNKETGGSLSPFNSPKPVAVGLIQVQDGDEIKLLGVTRNIPPFVGEDAFPGGYINQFEDPFVSVAREVLEETGLETDPNDYEIITTKNTDKNNILIFFKNNKIYSKEFIDSLQLTDAVKIETQKLVLLDKNSPICFSLHKEVAVSFFEGQEKKLANETVKRSKSVHMK